MELNYRKLGSGKPFIILHGLFGSSDNWLSHARKLADYFEVYLIDQRNHGDSPWSDEFNYDVMADDLHEFVEQHGLDDFILLGHSMGGKTSMRYAQKYPGKIDKLISVDMGVKGYPITHSEILAGLKAIDLKTVKSRSEASEVLAEYEPIRTVRQFLLKNLHRDENREYAWKINIDVLDKRLPEVVAALPEGESMVDTLFISGGRSEYILEEDEDDIRKYFPLATFYVIEEAGHWIHAEKPDEFMEEILSFSLL